MKIPLPLHHGKNIPNGSFRSGAILSKMNGLNMWNEIGSHREYMQGENIIKLRSIGLI